MNFEPTILYIPGFGSNGTTSTTFLGIEAEFRNRAIVQCLNYSNFEPEIARHQLLNQVRMHMGDHHHDHLLLVGSSFGGYWAARITNVLNLPFVLVNPCLRPLESPTLKAGFAAEGKLANMKHLQTAPIRTDLSHFVLLGGKDTVVPPDYAANVYPNHQILPQEGHRLQDLRPLLTKIHNHAFVSV